MKDVQNKIIRKTIIIVAILIAVIGCWIYYQSQDPGTVETETTDLIMMSSGEIKTVRVVDNSDDEISVETKMENKGNGLEIVERTAKYKEDATTREKDLKALPGVEENTVRLFEYNITNLKSLKTIEKNATNLAQYGFDKPWVVVDIILNDGQNKGFIVGKTTPTSTSAYYFKMQTDDTVYVIAKWDVQNFLLTKDNIIDMTL